MAFPGGAEAKGARGEVSSAGHNLRVLTLSTARDLRAEMEKIGCDPRGIDIMMPKGVFRAVKMEGVKFAAANILKQEMLAKGGEAVLCGDIYLGGKQLSDVLLLGTELQYRRLLAKLRMQPLPSLQQIRHELRTVLDNVERKSLSPLLIGDRAFEWGTRTYVMGILNVTPDSFSGDGLIRNTRADEASLIRAAVAQARQQASDGADIIDVGGESTRPGSSPISSEEEMRRVVPVIRHLRDEIDVVISIDTYKADVAESALDAGADLVNDVWALRADRKMPKLVAERQVPVVLMHNRSRPKDAAVEAQLGGRYLGVEYEDLLADVIRELRESVELALSSGVSRERILVDPGVGFGKTVEQNLELLERLAELRALGHPILLGPSRKSFIGFTLDLPPDQRVEGTAATVALGIARGADIVRVHDVREMVRVARMSDALVRRGE